MRLPDRWAVVAVDVETTEIKAVVSRHFWKVGAETFCREMNRVVNQHHMFQPRAPWVNVHYQVVRLRSGGSL